MSDDDVVLVCVRVADMPRNRMKGAGTLFCMDCKHSVWIAPTGQELLGRKPFVKVICVVCVTKQMEREGPPTEGFKVAPGAFKELIANGATEEQVARLHLQEFQAMTDWER